MLFTTLAVANGIFEPSITPTESKLLSRTAQLAETNIQAAAQFLAKQDIENQGPAILYTLGNLFFQTQDYDKAAEFYEKALEKLPEFRRAAENLGRVYLITGQTTSAIEIYQDFIKNGQADTGILLLLGHALLIEEKPLSAETAYKQALLLDPDNEKAKTGLAKALLSQERFRETAAILKELSLNQPENGEFLVLLANCYIAEQNHDQALVAMESARRLGYTPPGMLALLGDIYIYRQQPEDALTAYRQAMETETLSIERALRAARGLLALDDLDSAGQMLDFADKQLIAIENPDINTTSRLMILRAELARQRGNTAKALEICDTILDSDPLNGKALLMAGGINEEQGLTEQAHLQYERASRVSGYQAEALFKMAVLETKRGKHKNAIGLLERAQEIEHKKHVARYLDRLRQWQK